MTTAQDIATLPLSTAASSGATVYIEDNGQMKRIPISALSDLIAADGDQQLYLRQVAWGVPLKQNQENQEWGWIGNLDLYREYESRCHRHLLTNDGKCAPLSSVSSGVFADGTALDETKGHIMVIGPKLYYVERTDATTGVPYAWFSHLPIGGECIGNCNNGENICMGAYLGSIVNNALVSRSGLAPAGNRTIESFWNAAQVNGKSWGLVDYDHCKWMLFMGLCKYGSPNIQAKLGYGVGGSNDMGWDYFAATAANLKTGATKSLGDASGSIPLSQISPTVAAGANASRVSLLGVEDWWGWYWQMIQGVYFGNSENSAQTGNEIFLYEGNRMPSAAELASHPAGNFRQLARVTSSGWIKSLILGEKLDIFAKTLGGGSTSYWGDHYWANLTGQLLLWGGHASNGSHCGLAYADSGYPWSNSVAHVGSRLAYYGKLTFMSGKELMAAA